MYCVLYASYAKANIVIQIMNKRVLFHTEIRYTTFVDLLIETDNLLSFSLSTSVPSKCFIKYLTDK